MTTTTETRRVAARDGTNINFKVVHAGTSAPRIALVHSLAMDHTFWQPVIDRLGAGASVVAIDARGHGAADKPDGPYTAVQMADDLSDVVDHLGWSRVVAGGASMGGCVAQQFAIKYHGKTRALALMGTTSWYGPTALADWKGRADKALAEGLASLVGFQKTRWFSDAFREAHPDVVQRSIDVFLRNKIEAYAATCNMLGEFNVSHQLETIRVPTTILVGEEDYAAPPSMAQVLHDNILGSKMAIVPKARHLLPLEMPDLVAATLQDLLVRADA